MSETPVERPWSSARLRRDYITPELIAGTVLIGVVIALADESDGIGYVLLITVASMFVFWLTEVFAHFVAAQGGKTGTVSIRIPVTIRKALGHASGLVRASVAPLFVLVVGWLLFPDPLIAYWLSLWVAVIVLAVVGWIAFGGHKVAWYWRTAGALGTAALGLLAILLKILVH